MNITLPHNLGCIFQDHLGADRLEVVGLSIADDMFNCGDGNIYPAEVEAVLEKHPKVVQSDVTPISQAVKGEAPVAFVVLIEPGSVSQDALKQFALQNGPAYAHPRRIYFLDALPLASTNKVDRTVLNAKARFFAKELANDN